jgi:hypothetical protein
MANAQISYSKITIILSTPAVMHSLNSVILKGTVDKMGGQSDNSKCVAVNNADNGMITTAWGPAGWFFLHCITFGYPMQIDQLNEVHRIKADDYYKFFYYLGRVFPCKYCRDSYQQFFNELPLKNHLASRNDIITWLYHIHNKVNAKLDVSQSDIPALADVITKYEAYRAKCTTTPIATAAQQPLAARDEKTQVTGCVKPANGRTASRIRLTNCEDYIIVPKYLCAICATVILITIIVLCWWIYFRTKQSNRRASVRGSC